MKFFKIIFPECTLQRTLREMRILLSLQHENIIDIKDFLCDNSLDSLRDIYIVQVLFNHAELEIYFWLVISLCAGHYRVCLGRV